MRNRLLSLIKLWFEYQWIVIAVFYYALIIYTGYLLSTAAKEWSDSHIIIIVKKVHEGQCTTDSDCEGI
jgi:hypothetical protein